MTWKSEEDAEFDPNLYTAQTQIAVWSSLHYKNNKTNPLTNAKRCFRYAHMQFP